MKLSEVLSGLYEHYGQLSHMLEHGRHHNDQSYMDLKDSHEDLKEAISLVNQVFKRHELLPGLEAH